MRRAWIGVGAATLGLAACGGSASDQAVVTTTTIDVTTTTAGPTTTEAPTTTTSAPAATLPITVSSWSGAWNLIYGAGVELTSDKALLQFQPDISGSNLYGSKVTAEAAIYLEATGEGEPLNAVIVAQSPGVSSIPAKLVSAAGAASVGDPTAALEVTASFNSKVVPSLGTLSEIETKFEVTNRLDLYVIVANSDPVELLFIWTPAGERPSDFALDAHF